MNILRQIAVIGVLFTTASLIFPRHVYAYIDPGSGSYIFQIIVAGVLGGLYGIKLYWQKIVSFFKNLVSKKSDKGDE